MNPPLRLAVLLSGSGTTLQNLLDHSAKGDLPAAVAVSRNPAAFGLARARKAGVPALVVARKACGSRDEFSRRVFDHSRAARANLCRSAWAWGRPPGPDAAVTGRDRRG
jgi:phosphoribosylglycinamide formyltransferase 1